MKFYIKLIIIVLYTGFYGFAQTNINQTLGDTKSQVAYTITPSQDKKSMLATGYTDGYGATGKDILAYVSDLKGLGLLHKRLGGNGDEEIFSSITSADGNYILAGYTNSQTHGGKDAFIAKVDFNTLDIVWQKHFGDIGDDEFFDVIERQENNEPHYVAVGYTTQAGKGKEILHVVADEQGNLIRYATYGGAGDDVAKSVLTHPSNTASIIAGWTSSGSSYKNALVLTIDASGSVFNAYTYDAGAGSQFNQVAYNAARDEIYAVGYSTSAGTRCGLFSSIKTDFSAIQSQTFSNIGTDLELLSFQNHGLTAGMALQGYIYSTQGDKEGLQLFTDSQGHLLNATKYTSCIGDEIVYDGIAIDNIFYAVGSTASYGAGSNDLLLSAKIDMNSQEDDCIQNNFTLQTGSINFVQKPITLATLNSSLVLENTTLTSVQIDKTSKDVCSGKVAAIVCGKTLSLGNDTAICVFPYTLRSKFKCADHLWSDGSTADSLVVTKAGIYSLKVSHDTCSLTASIHINGGVSLASKQANIWYFGSNAGLNFNTPTSTVINNGTIASKEGTSAISDAMGEILFYSDGMTVRNRNHEIMTNGTGLLGDTSATQSSIIVPHPGDKNLYYLFTTPAWDGTTTNPNTGFNYNIIDMSKNGGLGEVVSKNNLLFKPCSEKLTAVRHANGRDIWVIAHESNSKRYRSYLITTQGLSDAAVISTTGTTFNGSTHNEGQLKASPIGNKLWIAIAGSGFQLLDFNNTTGTIQTPIDFIGFSINTRPYGCEFSPDGNKMFITDRNSPILRQYDISSGNKILIDQSVAQISNSGNNKWGLQLAPDGKIYVVDNAGGNTFGVINNPNASGADVDYQPNAYTLPTGATIGKNFPSFIQSLFKDKAPDFSYLDTCTATTTKFELLNFADTTALSWDFGDGQTSSVPNALHQYATGGVKTVTLSYVDACDLSGKGSISKNIEVIALSSVLKDTIACTMPLVLDVGANTEARYAWTTGDTTQSISVADTGRYKVVISSRGCSLADSAKVILGTNDKTPNFTYTDTCSNTHTQFTALNAPDTLASIIWNFGGSNTDTTANPKHRFEDAGLHTVTLTYTDLCGQRKDTTKTINILAADTVSLSSPKDTICFGERLSFSATYSGSDKVLKSWHINNVSAPDTGLTFTTETLAIGLDSVIFRASPANPTACAAKLSVAKTIFVKPSKKLSNSNLVIVKNAICEGDSIILDTRPSQPDSLKVTWLVNNIATDTTYPSDFSFKRKDLKNGDVVKFVLGSDLVCTNPLQLHSDDSLVVSSKPRLLPKVDISSITNPLCLNEKAMVKLIYNDAGERPSFQWQLNGNNIGNLSSDTTFERENLSDGDVVSAILYPDYSCPVLDNVKSNTVKFSIRPTFAPAIYISTATPVVCESAHIAFKIDSITGGGQSPTWEWRVNDVSKGRLSTFISNQFNNGDLVSATVTSTSNCANPKTGKSSPIQITVHKNPLIDLNDILMYCDQEQSGLQVDLGAKAGHKYLWNTGDTTATLDMTFGKYQVKVTNPEGCISEAKTSVIINCEPRVFIPSAFTPNDDGKNDKLDFFTAFTTAFKISFYDRWGEVIYSTDDPSASWDGSYLGKRVSTGVYNYVCTYGGLFRGNQETRVIKGDVSVLE